MSEAMFSIDELAVIADTCRVDATFLALMEEHGIPCSIQIAKVAALRAKAMIERDRLIKAGQAEQAKKAAAEKTATPAAE